MTITYRNTFRDRIAFFAYAMPRKPVFVLMFLAFLGFMTFETVIPILRESQSNVSLSVKVIAFFIMEAFILAAFFIVMAIITVLAMISKKNKPLYCERSLTVNGDGFLVESEYGRSETRWTMVQKLARTGSHIFLFLNSDSAVVIPRRAFADIGVWNSFYDICRSGTERK